ncbi:uncharacterized protein [Eurosta solidaginis]|uniref:uncharacterized protein n=1 Tax=Eurosta solidaginis TaxID=178769 RepID=UPI0035312E8A
MILRGKYEFVVLSMIFEPAFDAIRPHICMKRDKKTPRSSITHIRDWLNQIVVGEKSKLPLNSSFRFSQWRIFSGDAKLFTYDGVRFDRITVFMGEDSNYWMFYQHASINRRIEGSSRIPLKFCGCCLNHQYVKIMEVIKRDCLTKPGVY